MRKAFLTLLALQLLLQPLSTLPTQALSKDSNIPLEAWRDMTVTPWASLLCIHGLGLHAASYASFGKQMSHLGIPTYAIDVRGFGSYQNNADANAAKISQKKDTPQLDFDRTFQDIREALQSIHKAHPGIPVVILGESMGGAMALQAAADNPDLVDGLICSVPSKQNQGQGGTKFKATLSFIYQPNKELLVGPKVIERATSNKDVADEWERDPLSRIRFSAVDLLKFKELMGKNDMKAQKISTMPVLFLQGASDRLIKPTGTIDLFHKIKSGDKSLVMVGTAEHLIFEQGQFNDDMVDLVSSWLEKHVVSTPTLRNKAAREEDEQDVESARQALGHYKLAEGYALLGEYEKAHDELADCLRLARGSALATRANRLLLQMPEKYNALKIGVGNAESLKKVPLQTALDNDKPSLLIFCADWIEACKTINSSIQAALGTDASKFNVVWVDADDPKNEPLLKEYGVKPLPVILYLTKTNELFQYTLGNPGPQAIRYRINLLLEKQNKLNSSIVPPAPPEK